MTIVLRINDQDVEAEVGATILEAAQKAGIYIPTICSHPNLPPGGTAIPQAVVYRGENKYHHHGDSEGAGCGLCVVDIYGETDLKPACSTVVSENMSVTTESARIQEERQKKLAAILADHPHACLTCAQNEGCTRTQCSSNVPETERCCPQLGACELQAVAEYIGIPANTRRWIPTDLPVIDGPLFTRDYNLCIGCTRCVRVCNDLRGIGAISFVRDKTGRNIIGSIAPTLHESGCKFCTACVEVCPTGALMDKNVKAASRENDLVPCRAACPAGVDIPWYLRLIAKGEFDEAHSIIREKVPFPGVLGRVCIRPCEDACRRGDINEPIAVCALKRAAADRETGGWKKALTTKPDTGKKVAVIGSGPAGLTCAFYLKKAGRSVVVFEAEQKAGGMLRYGIPEYRLPAEVLDGEIQSIFDLGVEFRPGVYYGRDVDIQSLKEEGFDAVFLAVGAQEGKKLQLKGADLEGVMWGMDFLKSVRQGRAPQLSGNVVVVGGGNVAIDVALTARRTGASQVDLVCLENRDEMPAHEWECLGALNEGVTFHNSWGPKEITGNGTVNGLKVASCTRVFDECGLFNPCIDDDETKTINADYIILAVGQSTRIRDFSNEPGLAVENGLLVVNEDQSTSLDGVWAGGDVAGTPGSVIESIAAGRRAAASIDRQLGGNGLIDETLFERPVLEQHLGREDGFANLTRLTPPCVLTESRGSFSEIEIGFEEREAIREASRCLQCDLRLTIEPVSRPPEKLREFNALEIDETPETEGVYQLYDANKNVIAIKGVMNLRQALVESLETHENASYFEWEEDKMYSKRESELLQQYLQKHGEMPGGDDELDDLF